MRTPKLRGQWTVLACGAAYQAVLQLRGKGSFVLAKGYRLVASLGSSRYRGYVIEAPGTIIAAFRGTDGLRDLGTDLKLQPVPYPYSRKAGFVHRGFIELYQHQIRSPLMHALRRLSPNKKLILTGHSMGGALATLAAVDVALHTRFRKPCVYTFGSPKVGDIQFASEYDRLVPLSVRVENVRDVITAFPPALGAEFAYVHVNRALYVHFNRSNWLGNHKMRHYAAALEAVYPEAYAKLRKQNPGLLP
ncbi:hypothetical protein ACFFK0_20330 [Paenibacillus chartarius]|uniref:Fungal lipase-type domain-containing protein n=1 Tax=Paenibacillus chartarius TaxID=747481 RepID=A0ABV6DQB7_9BACL